MLEEFEIFLTRFWGHRKSQMPLRAQPLHEAVNYSLFGGGKRFRPQLSFATAQALKLDPKVVYPFAAAVEMIHTYSLIHDDLPCMDNDDVRRGKPTNHRQFSEALALLAGDSLLTEAFLLLSASYQNQPDISLKLINLLAGSAGASGMIAGQVMDLDSQGRLLKDSARRIDDQKDLEQLHLRKTGDLIRASVEGVGIIAGVGEKTQKQLGELGLLIGLSFQVADDIEDFDDHTKNEGFGFPGLMGRDAAMKMLNDLSRQTHEKMAELDLNWQPLSGLVQFNLKRIQP